MGEHSAARPDLLSPLVPCKASQWLSQGEAKGKGAPRECPGPALQGTRQGGSGGARRVSSSQARPDHVCLQKCCRPPWVLPAGRQLLANAPQPCGLHTRLGLVPRNRERACLLSSSSSLANRVSLLLRKGCGDICIIAADWMPVGQLGHSGGSRGQERGGQAGSPEGGVGGCRGVELWWDPQGEIGCRGRAWPWAPGRLRWPLSAAGPSHSLPGGWPLSGFLCPPGFPCPWRWLSVRG